MGNDRQTDLAMKGREISPRHTEKFRREIPRADLYFSKKNIAKFDDYMLINFTANTTKVVVKPDLHCN